MRIKTFVFNPLGVNTYILYDNSGECVIIDAACINESECNQLLSFIETQQLKVRKLINTHLHFDHCFGAPFINKQFGLKVCGHEGDFPLMEQISEQLSMFGFKPMSDPILLGEAINEGDVIRFGNSSLTAIHIPGHSKGSIVYYDAEGGNLFTGDVLFNESVGRSDLPGGDYFTLIDGIESKLMILPPQTCVYPGHGPTTTLQHEREHNPYLQ